MSDCSTGCSQVLTVQLDLLLRYLLLQSSDFQLQILLVKHQAISLSPRAISLSLHNLHILPYNLMSVFELCMLKLECGFLGLRSNIEHFAEHVKMLGFCMKLLVDLSLKLVTVAVTGMPTTSGLGATGDLLISGQGSTLLVMCLVL